MSAANGHDAHIDPQPQPKQPAREYNRVGISPRTGRPYGAPKPHWTKCKGYDERLFRSATLIQKGMADNNLTTKALTELLEPKVTVGAIHGWMGARNTMGMEHREALGRILGIDPNLLLPEHENPEKLRKRQASDRARETVFAKRGNPQPDAQPARPAPQPSPQAQAKHAATTALDDELEYSFNQVTGMAELRAVLRWADIDLRPLFELIRDERMKHVVW
jgi:hypothetical protein